MRSTTQMLLNRLRPARNTRDMTQSQPDPVASMLDHAPLDDEPLTAEEREALAESDADLAAGRTVSLDQLKRELGHQPE
jgi:hypothetical protein